MIWSYETRKQKDARLTVWHDWFAWYPVCENGKVAWLCNVRRCGKRHGMNLGGSVTSQIFFKYKINHPDGKDEK